jgi:hypothetical protein
MKRGNFADLRLGKPPQLTEANDEATAGAVALVILQNPLEKDSSVLIGKVMRTLMGRGNPALAGKLIEQAVALPHRMSTNCRSCGADILWVWSIRHKKMPVDAEPSERGNLILTDAPGGGSMAVRARDGDRELYTSHFATCPNAKAHRKPRVREVTRGTCRLCGATDCRWVDPTHTLCSSCA